LPINGRRKRDEINMYLTKYINEDMVSRRNKRNILDKHREQRDKGIKNYHREVRYIKNRHTLSDSAKQGRVLKTSLEDTAGPS